MDNDKQTFKLTIRSREGLIFEGEVRSLTSINESGKFDILAQHANFISLIRSVLEVGEIDGKTRQITIDNGLLRTRDNVVEIYLGVAGIAKQSTHV